MKKAIYKTHKRIKDYGEIFTPQKLVCLMLDIIPNPFWTSAEKTFLDPACGDGNFLVEVVERKIRHGSTPLQALQTTYGVDLMQDNVRECRRRLFGVAYSYDENPTEEWKTALLTNIRCANALEKSFEEIFSTPLDGT